MTQAEMNSSLIKMDQLRTLIDQHFPKAEIDYEDVCYINNITMKCVLFVKRKRIYNQTKYRL